MSTLMSSARTRVPRFAEAAVERARLTVVPSRPLGRTQAARTPFAVLVIALLAAGVVGLLMFNTRMQQSSFAATALQDRVNELSAEKQLLDLDLDRLRDPQRLAAAAKRQGMVAPTQPAFVRLGDGRVLGSPAPANSGDAMQIDPLPAPKPESLKQRTIIVRKAPETTPDTTPATDTPATSTTGAGEAGRKRVSTQTDSGATP